MSYKYEFKDQLNYNYRIITQLKNEHVDMQHYISFLNKKEIKEILIRTYKYMYD